MVLLHYSCLFQVRNNEEMIIFKQNPAKKFLVLNIKNINIITFHTHKTYNYIFKNVAMLFLFLDQGKKSLSENKCTACISERLFTGQSFCWSSVMLFSKPTNN